MMWTLIQRDGQRDCGLRDCVDSGLWPGGCVTGSHGLCISNASHVFFSTQGPPSCEVCEELKPAIIFMID